MTTMGWLIRHEEDVKVWLFVGSALLLFCAVKIGERREEARALEKRRRELEELRRELEEARAALATARDALAAAL